METETFATWFNHFEDFVTERPLLLLFDGHLAHISIPIIKRALDKNIIIVKFPPHVTDVLQPLDVSCFGPLKRVWERQLYQWINEFGIKHPLTRSEFVNELCAIWNTGMEKENTVSGFEKNRYKLLTNNKVTFEKLRLQIFITEKNKQLFLWPMFIQENMVHKNNYFFCSNKYPKP